jgi:hypothetical protein
LYTGDGHPRIPKLGDVFINSGLANALFYDLQLLRSSGVVRPDKKNLQNFGLAAPRASARLVGRDGSNLTIMLGGRSPVDDGYFLTTDRPDEAVYLVDEYYADILLRGLENYRNTQFLDFVYESDYDALGTVGIFGKNRLPLTFENGIDGFFMTKPIEYPCIQNELKVNLLMPLTHLKAEKYLGRIPLSGTGLDDPSYRVEMNYRGGDIAILIGDMIGSSRYCVVEGRDEVYLVDAEDLVFLDLDYRRAVGSTPYFRSIEEVDSLTVEDGETTLRFDVKPEANGEFPAMMGGKRIDSIDFVTLYNRIITLPLLGKLDGKPEGIPEMKITVALSDGRLDVVELTKINERAYAVNVNGRCEFSTLEAAVGSIREKMIQF